ncbi:MAG: M23 family metallopeptidase [Ruminococcaceae bacterium]|nr:M23 family metallopeptidase [Oscillospiraceae bacterium]
MEQVYRRRGTYSTPRRRVREGGGHYRQIIFKQSVACFLLFAAALGARLSPLPELAPVEHAIRLILSEHTDFSRMPGQLHDFFKTHILQKDNAEDLGSREPLMHLSMPVEAAVTSGFGLRTDPASGEEAFHYGVDLGAPAGETIRAAASGEAVEAGESDSYGNYILIRHSESVYTLYAHCERLLSSQGDSIEQGQAIATVGATGKAVGPHLHFEVRSGDTWLDPAEFISFPRTES